MCECQNKAMLRLIVIVILITLSSSSEAEETVTQNSAENTWEELREGTTEDPNVGLFDKYHLDLNRLWSTLIKGVANTNFCTVNIFNIGKTIICF